MNPIQVDCRIVINILVFCTKFWQSFFSQRCALHHYAGHLPASAIVFLEIFIFIFILSCISSELCRHSLLGRQARH